MHRLNETIFADYHQFVLQDMDAGDDLSDLWTEQSVYDMLAVGRDLVGVRTVRNLNVPVSVELIETDSERYIPQEWDQIVECSVDIHSGKIVVMGVTDYLADAAGMEVERGKYRVRIFYGNLDSISNDGLDGNDNYKLVMWPEPIEKGIVFLKRYCRI